MQKKSKIAIVFKPVVIIILIVIIWRMALFAVANHAEQIFAYSPSFPYSDSLVYLSKLPVWVYSWANFDGVHYLTIVQQGYLGTGLIQAFFPLYPLIIGVMTPIFTIGNAIQSGLVISFLSLLAGTILWWWATPLFLKQNPKNINQVRWLSVLLLVLFPTSFYFGAMYTEAIFFLLSISALILGIKRHFLLASIFAGLASGTRLVGVLLVPALLLEYWRPSIVTWWQSRHTVPLKSGSDSSKSRFCTISLIRMFFLSIAIIVIGSSGFLLYSGYLQKNFNDPLYFFSVQSQFGAGRADSIILYPQTAWRATKIILTARPFDWKYYAYTQEFLVGIVGLIAIIWSAKYVKPSIWLFTLLTFLLPTLTGTFSSLPRYFLTSYSVFLALAVVLSNRRKLAIALLLLSTFWLILNTMLFIQGYWVA